MTEYKQAMNHFDVAYELVKRSRKPFFRESAYVLRYMSRVFRQHLGIALQPNKRRNS